MATDGTITCEGISKVYDNRKTALRSIDLSIPAKGIFSLIGRNGAGKTTLARIMSTLLEPSSGTAMIDGLDVMKDARRLREKMAVVPQEGRTVPWMTPMQEVSAYLLWRGMSYRESRRIAHESLAQVGLGEQEDRLNRLLSGGMRRKVLVAMVIASGSEYIFLDEPSTGLDPISRRELWDLLIDLGREHFVFLTTHYLEEAEQVADRVGILNDGRLLAIGTMDDLRGRLKHQYSVRIPSSVDIPVVEGERLVSRDGETQIMTTEKEARDISEQLIQRKARFSINPVSLDDIFSYVLSTDTMTGQTEE